MQKSANHITIIAFLLALFGGWTGGAGKAVASQACIEKVRAMHEGIWNPFNRPPYRSVMTEYDSTGEVLRVWDNIVQSPLRTISGVRESGAFALVVESSVWTGPSPEGPWATAQGLPDGRTDRILRSHQFMIDGIHFAECETGVVLDGRQVEKYTYKVKTAPDETQGGLWLADTNVIYFDPASERIMQWEKTDFQSAWAPQVNQDRHVTVFEYDVRIQVDAPG